MSIELPKDAEGREIPLDVEVLYNANGESVKPHSFTFRCHDGFCWEMHLVGAPNLVYDPKSFYLMPQDSWDKLLEDLDRGANALPPSGVCAYSNKDGGVCADCLTNDGTSCDQAVLRDIASRIRTLRGEDA